MRFGKTPPIPRPPPTDYAGMFASVIILTSVALCVHQAFSSNRNSSWSAAAFHILGFVVSVGSVGHSVSDFGGMARRTAGASSVSGQDRRVEGARAAAGGGGCSSPTGAMPTG